MGYQADTATLLPRAVILIAILHLISSLTVDSAWADAHKKQLTLGLAIAQAQCSACHAIGRTDKSPTRINVSTAFRDLHKRYPIAMLVKAKRTGKIAGHDEMPAFDLKPSEALALLAYIDSLTPDTYPKYVSVKGK